MAHRIAPLLLLALCGCSTLLPSGSSKTPTTFASFDEARAAAERIVAFKTRTAELKDLGFDIQGGHNVTLIPYPDIVSRLAPYSGVPLESLDAGVAQCVRAQAGCRGYLFHFERQDRHRDGNFWLDFLNIRRITNFKGWSFDALVVESGGTVLFRSIGGQASTDHVERQTNPLGPFQPAGEGAATILLR